MDDAARDMLQATSELEQEAASLLDVHNIETD
jgi:hypothetical protein